MKKRWISLYVENEVGVLAKIAGLFSSKSYNMDSLTVGPTEDETVSRITIGVISDDATYEQIKKQLNRCVEIITVLDFTEIPIHRKELMYVRLSGLSVEDKQELRAVADVFGVSIIDYGKHCAVLECVKKEADNNLLIRKLRAMFQRVEVVRGGSVAIEAIPIEER